MTAINVYICANVPRYKDKQARTPNFFGFHIGRKKTRFDRKTLASLASQVYNYVRVILTQKVFAGQNNQKLGINLTIWAEIEEVSVIVHKKFNTLLFFPPNSVLKTCIVVPD